MQRALLLAKKGEGRVSPNPMVGAVIVHDGKIIGEGYHAFFGGPHAEVNAIRSVPAKLRHLLKESTIYVTLEPCAHFGKTPPCANLIVESGIPEVVIGSPDPNPLVAGKGIKILENAGVKVTTGVLREECDLLNRKFLRAQTSSLPFITLKWARSADGFMAPIKDNGEPYPVKFSSPLSAVWMHRHRAGADAVMIGANTEKIDHPLLTVRYWGGNSPKKIVAQGNVNLKEMFEKLRKEGVSSVIVEGGPTLLKSLIKEGLYDEIRIETAPMKLGQGLVSPTVPSNLTLSEKRLCRKNLIEVFRR